MSVKRSFDGEGQKDYSVDLHGVKDDPRSGIDDETILLRSWSSICAGATLWGLENSPQIAMSGRPVQSRISRHSYGVCFHTLFDKSQGHQESDRIRGSRGEWRAANQMGWFLRQGDHIREGRTYGENLWASIQVGFFDSGNIDFSDQLYYCADDVPPSRKGPSVELLCEVEYGIDKSKPWMEKSYKNPLTKEKWRDATFTLQFEPGSASILFKVFYKGEQVAYTRAKYANDS
ncbi:MAG: hypothetical protein Q9190_003853 [Brigantiaea leucoxantha]